MRVLGLLLFILGISQLTVFAQTQSEKTGCPVFAVDGPSSAVGYNKPIIFRLNIDRKLNSSEKLFWTTSAGKILSGQGTESIAVENVSETGRNTIAVVEITGLPKNCPKTAQFFLHYDYPEIPTSIKVDKFGVVTAKVLSDKINNLSQKLKEDPSATASIIKYFEKYTNKLDVYLNLQLILNYLKSDGIDEERINFKIPLENGEITEFWFVPAGAAFPLSDTEYEHLDTVELKRKIVELSKTQ